MFFVRSWYFEVDFRILVHVLVFLMRSEIELIVTALSAIDKPTLSAPNRFPGQ
jgi:hypothetical protein